MPRMNTISIALWVENFSFKIASLDAWLALVAAKMDVAKAQGCDLLMLPEHNGEHWMHFAPDDLAPPQEVGWMAQQMVLARPALESLAREKGIALLSGSTSWPVEGRAGEYTNRAWLFFPDRAPVFHDKLALTPYEKDPSCWLYQPGQELKIVEWRGLKMGFIICLDSEMPVLAHRLAVEDIDLLLVPSQTGAISGYNRVFSCCRARAVELFCPVAVVGCAGGTIKNGEDRGKQTGGAAVYIPAELALGGSGVLAETLPHDGREGEDEMLVVKDIPIEQIRALRQSNKAEAWPGPFGAEAIKTVRKA